MASNPPRRQPDLLSMPEIVENIIKNVGDLPDLLNCACVSKVWNVEALRRLYEGSMYVYDMRFRTPDTTSLHCLVASRGRFAQSMSFVKHVLVCPETPRDDAAGFDRGHAAPNRPLIRLLLQPRGSRPTSLTIPFEFMHRDWELLANLLPAPTVEFLAINHGYCQLVASRFAPVNRLSNLKALTVYASKLNANVDSLCRLLNMSSLKFFHYEAPASYAPSHVAISDPIELMRHIRRQRNLEALALHTDRSPWMTPRPACTASEAETPWPRLKLLHLGNCNEDWLRELPKFKNLTSLHLGMPVPYAPDTSRQIGEAVMQCRHLQDISLQLWELKDSDVLLGIARACPLLRGVTIRLDKLMEIPPLTKSFLFNLLRALPRLELLDIFYRGSGITIQGSDLGDIARYCPRLQVLLLPWVILNLSYSEMTQYYPQRRLEIMELDRLWLRDCWQAMDRNRILAEWRRIFPRLRAMPCDMESLYFSFGRMSLSCDGEHDAAGASTEHESHHGADEDMTVNNQGSYFLDDSPGLETFHQYFSAALGYEHEDIFGMHHRICRMWRANIEVELVGWPVVPLDSFVDPNRQSSIP